MKKMFLITLYVLIFCIAIFLGLSNVTIQQTQHQKQTQQQVQRQDNLQLVFMDTRMKITNVSWEVVHFETSSSIGAKYLVNWMNINLNFFQQVNAKVYAHKWNTILIYPVFNKKKKTYTNSNFNYNTNHNEIKLDILGRLKNWKQ